MPVGNEVRKYFSKMPDEVFSLFLEPQLKPHAWSLPELETFITGASESIVRHFRNQPLHYWAGITWRLTSLPFSAVNLDPDAMNMVRQIVNFFGKADPSQPAIRAQIPNSHERFNAAASFAKSFGKFPKPLVCLVDGDSWVVLDGYHRLAAMFTLEKHESFQFDAWVGTHAL